MHVVSQSAYGLGKMVYVLRRLPQQVQHQSQGAAGAYSRQGAYGLHGVLE